MKKLLFYIFIPVLAILLMSHNVSAINFSYNLNNYELVKNYYSGVNTCSITGGTNIVSGTIASCNVTVSGTTTIKSITFNPNFNIKKGDLLEFYVLINLRTPEFYMPSLSNINGNLNNFNTINFESVKDEDTWKSLYSVESYINNNDVIADLALDLDELKSRYSLYRVSQIALRDLTRPDIGLDAISSSTGIFQLNSENAGGVVVVQIRNLNVYRFVGSEENAEVEEKTQDAADASETAGGSSGSSSQGATSNLLSVFTGFANVITNASATNCVINAPLNTTFSNDVFNVDLCGLSLPPAIGALTSIIAVMVVVPFAVSMFNKFVGIMESFQK